MRLVQNNSTDPYFNLALEEYLFKNFEEDFFMLWCNENAVVVGKHQNAVAEVNMQHIREKNIKVVRRLSGGGTVFHDLGNINFTFISTGETTQVVDFRKYMTPILEVLLKLGLNASFSDRNDLLVEGKKVSGNAEHAVRKRILHHGTLLYNSDISNLGNALKIKEGKYIDKAVKSVRSEVTNISSHLLQPLSQYEFVEMVYEHIKNTYKDCMPYVLSKEDLKQVQYLADTKFSTWNWNFGYSPKYSMNNTVQIDNEPLHIVLQVQKGVIVSLSLEGALWEKKKLQDIEQLLIGKIHEEEAIRKELNELELHVFPKEYLDQFINAMF